MKSIRRPALLALLLLVSAAPATRPTSYPVTGAYTRKTIRGWTVLVSNDLLTNHAQTATDALALLDVKLFDVTRVVPAKALEKIRTVPIWLETNDTRFPGGAYHPSRQWLTENGFNPDKAKAVELGNARNFLRWSLEQPYMVLHELAHAYHDQVLGYDNADILAAYTAAKSAGIYDAVLRINGHVEKAYAMNNDQEYFAELSEAYFGTNDFYPFVRAEVQKHDPTMYEVLEKDWGD